jgi:WD40 repeat protein
LSGPKVTDEKAAWLASRLHYLPGLRQIDLFETEVTDKGFGELAQVINIERMHIQGERISDAVIAEARAKRPAFDVQRRAPDPVATGLAAAPVYREAIVVAKFSPNDDSLFFGSGDGVLHRHPLKGTSREWQAHEKWLFDLAFSPDGQLLATAAGDRRLQLWDASPVERLASVEAGENDLHGVAWIGDRLLVTAGDDRSIRAWRVEQRGVVSGLELVSDFARAHTAAITRITASPDRKMMLTASRDNSIGLWKMSGDQIEKVGSLEGHTDDVMGIAVHPKNSQAVSASYDGSLIVWDLQLQSVIRRLPVSKERLYCLHVEWDAGRVTVGHHRGIRSIDLETGASLNEVDDQQLVASLAYSPARGLVSTSADGGVIYRDTALRPVMTTRNFPSFVFTTKTAGQ